MNLPVDTGSRLRCSRGALLEYGQAAKPLELHFEFNPSSLTRSRSLTVGGASGAGSLGGYDFQDRSEAPRAAQGVSFSPETLSLKVLFDATDRMAQGDPAACSQGVQPELDVLRAMVEPKVQSPEGARTLAALGHGSQRAFSRQQFASVLLFCWGVHTLPVFITQVQVELKEFLPSLVPYRAEASLTLQVIESVNPFYTAEAQRLLSSAAQAQEAATGGMPWRSHL